MTSTGSDAVPEPTWRADDELAGFECCDLPLSTAPLASEPTDDLTATLVRCGEPSRARAVLYVHGWNDYFYQAHLAEFWREQGFDFYALDLRRYGRSLRPGQLGGYVADLDDHFEEIDLAVAYLSRHHAQVTLNAHSTGGLVGALYADAHPDAFTGLVLNSPWLDLHGSRMFRTVTATVLGQLANRAPTTAIPLPDTGFYRRTIDARLDGEWTFNDERKGGPSFSLWSGWMRAVLSGHARVTNGLSIQTPVLVALSARSDFHRSWNAEAMTSADAVLDVRKLALAASGLGRCVTILRVDGGLHDLVLSRKEVRDRYFTEVATWLRAYVPEQ